jgi:uncharacterized protein YraI
MHKRLLLSIVLLLFVAILALSIPIASAEFGVNWTAAYFNCPSQPPGTSTIDINTCTQVGAPTAIPSGVNFNYAAGSPASGINADNFIVRYESVQTFQQGAYDFIVASDDGVRIFIDGTLVWDRFIGRVFTTDRFQQNMTAGTHSLRIEFLEIIDTAQIQFQYYQVGVGGGAIPTSPGVVVVGTPLPPTVVPPTALPPIPPGALTATVIRASVLNVRAAPYLGAPRIGRILRGQTYAIVGRDERAEWFLLQLSGGQAWAWGYYLFVNGNEFNAPVVGDFTTSGDPAANAPATVQTEATLRLRAAPNILSQQIGRVPWGDILPVIGRTAGGDWYQVVFRGTIGWVVSSYVKVLEGDLNAIPITG